MNKHQMSAKSLEIIPFQNSVCCSLCTITDRKKVPFGANINECSWDFAIKFDLTVFSRFLSFSFFVSKGFEDATTLSIHAVQ